MEELNDFMQKFEKIKRAIHNFKNEFCPKCNKPLKIEDVDGKTSYECRDCNLKFWDNQFYETYFDEIMRSMEE